MTAADLPALEAELARLTCRAIHAGSVAYYAHTLRLELAPLARELAARRNREAAVLRGRVREARVAAGLCRRCGFRPSVSYNLCADCLDDLGE